MIYKCLKYTSRDIQGRLRRIPGIVWCRRLFSPRFLLVLLLTSTVVITSITLLHLVNLLSNMSPITPQHSLDIRSAGENTNFLSAASEEQLVIIHEPILTSLLESNVPPSTVFAKQSASGASVNVVDPSTPDKPSVAVAPLKLPVAPVTVKQQIDVVVAKHSVATAAVVNKPTIATTLAKETVSSTLKKETVVTVQPPTTASTVMTQLPTASPTKPRTFAAPRTQYFKSSDFEGFNNESGVATAIVPNIVHFLRFDQPQFKFTDVVCILAAVKNHRPDQIYIHTNDKNFTGKYWELLLKNKEFNKIFKIKYIELPQDIFGQKFSNVWHKHHASDVARIKILMEYGGIYVDNDSYIVKSLEKYRHFEMALAWDEDQFLGTQTLIAHSKARFLPLWLDSYRSNYHADKWYYNAGERPTTTVLVPRPELVHRVKLLFGAHIALAFSVYQKQWPEWRNNFAIHLLLNFRWQFDKDNFEKIKEFDENNILNHNFTVGEMIRDILIWNKNNS